MAKKNPVSDQSPITKRLDGLLEGRVARATYCLDQLYYVRTQEERDQLIELAKMDLQVLERAIELLKTRY